MIYCARRDAAEPRAPDDGSTDLLDQWDPQADDEPRARRRWMVGAAVALTAVVGVAPTVVLLPARRPPGRCATAPRSAVSAPLG